MHVCRAPPASPPDLTDLLRVTYVTGTLSRRVIAININNKNTADLIVVYFTVIYDTFFFNLYKSYFDKKCYHVAVTHVIANYVN